MQESVSDTATLLLCGIAAGVSRRIVTAAQKAELQLEVANRIALTARREGGGSLRA